MNARWVAVAAVVTVLLASGGTAQANPLQQAPLPRVCAFLHQVVPAAVIADAVAHPEKVYGWNKRANPNAPLSPYNQPRTSLSLRSPGQRYHSLYNGLLFAAGCPAVSTSATPRPATVPPTDPATPPTPPTRPVTPTPITPTPGTPVPPVVLVGPSEPVFVGSYVEVPVRIEPGAGLAIGDLDFVLPDGDKAGHVSRSTERGAAPSFMLLVGHDPGTYPILATKHGTGTVIATAHFTSTDVWTGTDAGPSAWLERPQSPLPALPFLPIARADAAAPDRAARAAAAPATPKLVIVIADTSTNRYTGSEGTDAVATWEDEARDGVAVGGVTRSTKAYYAELTGGAVNLDVEVRGPFSLTGNWDTYFEASKEPKWDNLFQACADAVDAVVDFTTVFSLACVTKGAAGDKFAWPYAWARMIATDEGNITLPVISMPVDWPSLSGSGGRPRHVTLAHEFGHNLGLPDEYWVGTKHDAALESRDPDGWTLMSAEAKLPHVTVPERRWLGTTAASAIRTFDYGGATAPFAATVELHPAELGSPPAGRSTGVEIMKAAGWSYWCEYRVGQSAQIGDRALPTNDRVLCTDVQTSPAATRRNIVILPNDASGDGPVLGNLQDYTEIDPMNPDATLKLSVSAMDGSKARLAIEYGPRGRPDPSIRPWPASPSRPWQSPDIEIKNDRTKSSPAFFNMQWPGHDNEVWATVRNLGTIDATGVEVEFYVKDYNVGGTPPATFLGTTTTTIPAGGTVTVQAPTLWQAPAGGHYCLEVRIGPYSKPVGGFMVDELTGTNNIAQSNYDDHTSISSSPASRETTTVKVTNPYAAPALIGLSIDQTRDDFRTYLEHRWLRMAAGETRTVRVMFESTRDVPLEDPDRQTWAANHVSITASIFNPLDPVVDSADILGGAEARVRHGWATRIDTFDIEPPRAVGQVLRFDGRPAPGGWVIIEFTDDRGGNLVRTSTTVAVNANGRFSATVPGTPWSFAQAFFVPVPGYGDSESKRVPRP